MALLELFGVALPLIYTNDPGPIAPRLLYTPISTEFGLKNSDGSFTFGQGTGLVWDAANGKFKAGTVSRLTHWSNGHWNDALTMNNVPVAQVEAALVNGFAGSTLMQGSDTLDASVRRDNAVVDDHLEGENGNDNLKGGTGSDELLGGNGADALRGDGGDDDLIGDFRIREAYKDTLVGGDGDDFLYGGGGNDVLQGGSGLDTAIFPTTFKSLKIVLATPGNFTVTSKFGTATLSSIERIGADDGLYTYNASTNVWTRTDTRPGVYFSMPWFAKVGTAGADSLTINGMGDEASFQHGVILGGDGNDDLKFYGTNIDGVISGGNGDDKLRIQSDWAATVRAYGGAGNDDLAIVYNGSHVLDGGAGNDTLHAGFGADLLTGGTGYDLFDFPIVTSDVAGSVGDEISFGNDTITDFVIGTDHIKLPENAISRTTLTQRPEGLQVNVAIVDHLGATTGTATILLAGVQAPNATLSQLR